MYQRDGSELSMSGEELLSCTLEQMRGWVESGITVFACNDGETTEEQFQHTRSLLQQLKQEPVSRPVDSFMLNAKLDILLDDEENGVPRFAQSSRSNSPSPAPTATPPTEEELGEIDRNRVRTLLAQIHEMGGIPFVPSDQKGDMDFEKGNWPTRVVLSDSEKRWRAFRSHQKEVRRNRKVWRSFLQAAKQVARTQNVDYKLQLNYQQSKQDQTADWQEWFCWSYISHDETLKLWEVDEYHGMLDPLPWYGIEWCFPRQAAEFKLEWHIAWVKEQELLSRTLKDDQTSDHSGGIKPTSRKRKSDHEDPRPLKKTAPQLNLTDGLRGSKLPAAEFEILSADASTRRRSQRLIDRTATDQAPVSVATRNGGMRKLAKPRSKARKLHPNT